MNIAAVILAAGKAVRMGKLKQLLPLHGETILGSTIDLYTKAGIDKIIVVVGHCAGEIMERLQDKPVQWVGNDSYEEGMSTSLKAGIAALDPSVEAAFLALGDTPFVSRSTIMEMLKVYGETRAKIIVPYFNEKGGHPVLFRSDLFPEIAAIRGDMGAREVIQRCRDVYKLQVRDPGIMRDIDTQEDYARVLKGD